MEEGESSPVAQDSDHHHHHRQDVAERSPSADILDIIIMKRKWTKTEVIAVVAMVGT